MKKLLLLLFVSMLVGYCTSAQTVVRVGQAISSADTVQVEVELDIVRPPSTYQTIHITLPASNSGTIKFSVGKIINAAQYSWPAGSTFPITIRNGKANLRYKASAADQVFVITQ